MTIRIKLSGGLGNQMFQFAAGYSLARKNDVKLSLDLRRFARRKDHNGFELEKVFDIFLKVKFLNNPLKFNLINFKEILHKIDITYSKFNEPHFQYTKRIQNISSHTKLNGYWQSELYFQEYAKEIKQIFSFSKQLDKKNSLLTNEIKKNNSISIHIRRGDYLLSNNSNHNTNLEKYYLKAVNSTHKLVNNPKYFVFTDDPNWVIKNFSLDYAFKVVDINHGTDSYLDMYLMSQCKINIIANSSFSWWAAWLNNNKNKVIYAPKNWFKDKKICINDLIPKSWNLI